MLLISESSRGRIADRRSTTCPYGTSPADSDPVFSESLGSKPGRETMPDLHRPRLQAGFADVAGDLYPQWHLGPRCRRRAGWCGLPRNRSGSRRIPTGPRLICYFQSVAGRWQEPRWSGETPVRQLRLTRSDNFTTRTPRRDGLAELVSIRSVRRGRERCRSTANCNASRLRRSRRRLDLAALAGRLAGAMAEEAKISCVSLIGQRYLIDIFWPGR
jgi:hypothetical protein